jgi:hypothetical protein
MATMGGESLIGSAEYFDSKKTAGIFIPAVIKRPLPCQSPLPIQ